MRGLTIRTCNLTINPNQIPRARGKFTPVLGQRAAQSNGHVVLEGMQTGPEACMRQVDLLCINDILLLCNLWEVSGI